MWGDHLTPWFCFDNSERAKQLLGAEEALLAKIVIQKYLTTQEHKGVVNGATLVKVIDTIPIKP